jgi:hypothetical protein
MLVVVFALIFGRSAAQLKYEQWQALMHVFDALNCTTCPRFSVHDPCPSTTTPSGRLTGPTLTCQGTVVKGMYVIGGRHKKKQTRDSLFAHRTASTQGIGSIPTTIGILTNLEYFGLSGGNTIGTLPTELGKLTALKQLCEADIAHPRRTHNNPVAICRPQTCDRRYPLNWAKWRR